MPEYQVTLEDLRMRSRQATVEAFLKVARQARSEGRLALARRYEDMASDQRRQWSLSEPPEPIRETTQQDTVMLTLSESKNQDLTVLPSAKQEASSTPISSPSASIPQQISALSGLFSIILSPEPMEWSSLPTLESGLHDSLTDWVRFKGSEGRFAAWKGNAAQAQGIADTLSHLLRLPDPELQRALQDALGEITREQHASLCRQGTSESHALLYRMRRTAAEHEWENAAVLLHNLLDINSRCRDCEGLAWPELSEKERILSAAEYLDLFRRAGRDALAGDFLSTDSLMESARQLFSEKLSDLDPDMQRDRINWAQGLPSAGYLHYLTKQYIGKQDPLEGLRCLKALHALGEQAENTSLLQTSLGTQLAEHDLAHTTLRNPITLIAAHIGSDSWYDVLRKAYRKRFNKG
ncbi:MAG: hypothetical protein IH599_10200 [Bacteroidales bacterium]|nr:hypothetical protein [Bacteroidales bacterium]